MTSPRLYQALLAGLVLLLISAAGPGWAQTTSPAPAPGPAPSPVSGPAFDPLPEYRLPRQITICGESVPLQSRDVYERMDFEFLVVLNGRVQAYLWLRRAGRYFPYIEKRLAEEGLPDDLKYLAVAESDLKVAARSRAAAMGAWQFMDFTGRIYGLRKDEDFDERLHFQKSTEAAIKYLKKLKGMFGSWTLAMAAYNCGEGCIRKAMDEQEVGDYFRLDLPEETERYVYRIAAIKVLLENPGRYGYDIEPDQVYPELDVDRASVSLAQEIHITQAAKAIGTDYKVIKELNPEINGSHLPKGASDILTPAGMGPKLEAFLKTAVPADAKAPAKAPGKDVPEFHVVRKGDTLNSISQRTGVPMDTIRQLNGIKANEIAVGQKLKLKP